MEQQITQGLKDLGIFPPDQAAQKMDRFVQALLEKNKVMNLTAITDPKEVLGLHLLDSAAMLYHLPQEAKKLIDVGTGAGFPGIPLKILRPSLELTLMDALDKRLKWLDQVAQDLDLDQVKTLHGRGEDLTHRVKYREEYDVATVRAVAEMRIVAELCLPFLQVGGRLLAMKSRDTGGEIEVAKPAIHLLGGVITQVEDYEIPGMDVVHRVVVVEKIAHTPEDFPRRWAKIQNTVLE